MKIKQLSHSLSRQDDEELESELYETIRELSDKLNASAYTHNLLHQLGTDEETVLKSIESHSLNI